MLIEIHMLKNYAPTNLNRDDSGSPKTCMFGGVQRGRVSSQCLKRSWRTSDILQKEIGKENIGVRTRKLPEMIRERLVEMGISEEYALEVAKYLTGTGKSEKNKKKDKEKDHTPDASLITKQIILYSHDDIEQMARLCADLIRDCEKADDVPKAMESFDKTMTKGTKDSPAAVDAAEKRSITLDIALFGRMVTSTAFRNVEAAMQVAHAISTNRVMMESDFFTAVDDLISGEAETGSGMMGDIDYNSSCYYIYASIDTDKLSENLGPDYNELVKATVPALIKTMAFSNPSGKQNTLASPTLPSTVLVECKDENIPVSYANAFERPVYADRSGGYIFHSTEKLLEQAKEIQEEFGLPVAHRFWFTTEKEFAFDDAVTTNCSKFADLVDGVKSVVGGI